MSLGDYLPDVAISALRFTGVMILVTLIGWLAFAICIPADKRPPCKAAVALWFLAFLIAFIWILPMYGNP